MSTKEDIMKALSKVPDPELGIDVVSLGLIYEVKVEPTKVKITMTLTTPGCPLLPYFHEQLEAAVKNASDVKEVEIDLTFDPPWHPDRMKTDAKKQLSILRS